MKLIENLDDSSLRKVKFLEIFSTSKQDSVLLCQNYTNLQEGIRGNLKIEEGNGSESRKPNFCIFLP